ncbi:MAG: hypothetical protein ACE5I1_00630 [bacterium]
MPSTIRRSLLFFVTAGLLFNSNFVIAQNHSSSSSGILQISEKNKDSSLHRLNKKPFIVDINSTVFIRIDKDALRRQSIDSTSNAKLKEMIETALRLQEAADSGLVGLKKLQAVLSPSTWPDSLSGPNSDSLAAALKDVAKPAGIVLKNAPRGSTLRNIFNNLLIKRISVKDQYRVIFEAAAEEAERLKAGLDNALKSDGVYYQLGAWISGNQQERPVHLRGFDEYPEGDDYEVESWNFNLSTEQQKDLQALKTNAQKLNEKGLPNVIADLRKSAPKLILNRIRESLSCIEDVEQAVALAESAGKESVQEFKDIVASTKKSFTDYRDFLIELRGKLREDVNKVSESPDAFLTSVKNHLSSFQSRTESLVNVIKRLENLLKEFEGDNKIEAAANSLKNATKACGEQLKSKITNTVGELGNALAGLVSVKQIDVSLLEFGDEVLKLDIENMPDSTEVNLIKTGARASGDALVLRMAMGKAENNHRKTIDSSQIQLFHVEPHLRTVVGMIYARPQSKNGIDNDFRIVPTYSVLLTKGSRGSIAYNRLFQPAFGLNVAAMDFDHDNAPEVGIGLVFSIFQDYLQAGYGYNLHAEVGYGFFGLRLPIPTLGAAGGN